jgi:hypothetical protein
VWAAQLAAELAAPASAAAATAPAPPSASRLLERCVAIRPLGRCGPVWEAYLALEAAAAPLRPVVAVPLRVPPPAAARGAQEGEEEADGGDSTADSGPASAVADVAAAKRVFLRAVRARR